MATPLDELRRIDHALTVAGGNRSAAARALEMDEKKVYNLVASNALLRNKWGNKPEKDVPDEVVGALHRDIPPAVRLDEALVKEEAASANRQKLYGFKDEELQFLNSLESEYSGAYQGALDLTYGGLMYTVRKLLIVFRKLEIRLDDVIANPSKYLRVDISDKGGEKITKTDHEHFMEIVDRLKAVSTEIRAANADANNTHLTRVKMLQMAAELGGGPVGKKNDKPEPKGSFSWGDPPKAVSGSGDLPGAGVGEPPKVDVVIDAETS